MLVEHIMSTAGDISVLLVVDIPVSGFFTHLKWRELQVGKTKWDNLAFWRLN